MVLLHVVGKVTCWSSEGELVECPIFPLIGMHSFFSNLISMQFAISLNLNVTVELLNMYIHISFVTVFIPFVR